MMNLFLFFYLHYRRIEKEQMFISNGLYSTWNVVLRDADLGESEILPYLPNDGRLFFEHDITGRLRSFYQNSNWQPPLVEGDFFDEKYGGLQAVVGIHVLQNMENDDYLEIDDHYYEVIGVIGVSYPSPLDHLVLLNNRQDLPVVRIVADSDNPRALNEVPSQFEVLTVNVNQAMTRFLNSNRFDQLISLNVWAILGVLLGVSAYICFDLFKKTYAVFSLVGYARSKIFRQQAFVICGLFLVSMISVLIPHLIIEDGFVISSLFSYFIVLISILLFYALIVVIAGAKGDDSYHA